MNANIVEKANQIIKSCGAAYLAVLDESGSPHVSAVSNIGAEDIFQAYFAIGTEGNKYRRLKRDNRASVSFRASATNITLTGITEIVTEQETKNRLWQDGFINHFPLGPTDPTYCIIKFITKRVSFWIDNESAEFTIDELLTVQSYCGLVCTGCMGE